MGGRGGGKSKPAPAPDNSAMIALIQSQMAQQAEQFAAAQKAALEAEERATKAQEEAALRAENVSASEKMQQSFTNAQSNLANLEARQQLEDAQAQETAAQQYAAAGAAATGGGYDINAAREEALKNLGAASGTLPSTAANRAAMAAGSNPAMTTAASQLANMGAGGSAQRQNVFTLPQAKNLTFGGS
jgi:hypothetical protein